MHTKIKLHRAELAINGGEPVRKKGWSDNFTTGEEEKKAVCDVLDSGYLSLFEGSYSPDPPFNFWGGPKVQELEERWCEYYGAKYAISMNSATSGLYAAIGALEVGYGDEVIVSPYTMSACAVGTLIYGAIPIFADVELNTGCLDPTSIRKRITRKTKAILVVHQFGIPADMDAIMAIAKEHSLKVIEDCAQAHGAQYKGKYVGTFGDIGVFSLNVNKTIQSGEGGVAITKGKDLRYRLALIRNHGEAVVGPAQYQSIVNIIGFNFRMTELQAAVASEQLKKLDYFNTARLELVDYLSKKLKNLDCFIVPDGRKDCLSTYYIYPLRYLKEKTSINRNQFVEMLKAEGIIFAEGYVKPLYLQPVYQTKQAFKFGYPFAAPENRDIVTNYHKGSCPNAELLHFEQMISNEYVRYPHTMDDMKDIVRAINKLVGKPLI